MVYPFFEDEGVIISKHGGGRLYKSSRHEMGSTSVLTTVTVCL
jgi:hypothetical protein